MRIDNTEQQHRPTPEATDEVQKRRLFEPPSLERHEDLEQITSGEDNFQFGTMGMS